MLRHLGPVSPNQTNEVLAPHGRSLKLEKIEMSTFQIPPLQEDYTCDALILISLLISVIHF